MPHRAISTTASPGWGVGSGISTRENVRWEVTRPACMGEVCHPTRGSLATAEERVLLDLARGDGAERVDDCVQRCDPTVDPRPFRGMGGQPTDSWR